MAAGNHFESEAPTMPPQHNYHTDLRCTENIENIPTDTCFPETPSPEQLDFKKGDFHTIEQSHISQVVNNGVPELPNIDHGQGPPVHALQDATIIKDIRVLRNLLKMEDNYLPGCPDYFKVVQKDLQISMRKIVADWMLQVCQELTCQPEVFCMAMSYMDRFLAKCRVTKSKLQLLGSVCLLLSSKFKETCPIPGEKLIYYTDYSITSSEITDWELLVLQKLGWELSSVTALDYIDHIITRLELDPKNVDLMDLKRRAETIIVLATTEYQFSYLSPSLLAASAIYTALKCLSLIRIDLQLGEFKNLKEIRQRIQSATHCIPKDIEHCMKNLLPILPSYLLEFPLPTLSRVNNCSSGVPLEKVSTDSSSSKQTSSYTTLSSHNTDSLQTTSSSSPTSTTSSPATSGLVGDFKTLTSNISGIASNHSSNECINEPPTMDDNANGMDHPINEASQSTTSSTSSSSCTSNAVNHNKSFSILVS